MTRLQARLWFVHREREELFGKADQKSERIRAHGPFVSLVTLLKS